MYKHNVNIKYRIIINKTKITACMIWPLFKIVLAGYQNIKKIPI